MPGARLCRHLTSGSTGGLETWRHCNLRVPRRAKYKGPTRVVLSTTVYQRHRPDVILGLITTRSADPLCPTDYEISDSDSAGLHARSCFRLYVVTMLQEDVRVVGRLSGGDWDEVKLRVQVGIVGE